MASALTDFYTSDSSAQSSPNLSDDEGCGKKKKSQNDSCADVGCLDIRTPSYHLQQLKGLSPSLWNDKHASHVYKGFKVTKYMIENNFIFDPTLDQDYLRLTEVLYGRPDRGNEWLRTKEKLEEVLGLFFVPGVEKMANGLFDRDIFVKASALLQYQIQIGKYSQDDTVKKAQIALESFFTRFIKDVKESYASCQAEEQDELKKDKGKKKQVAKLKEGNFEHYLETLFYILSKLTRDNPELRKSCGDNEFTTSLLGTVSPKPDFFVLNYRYEVAAVVEVKPHDKQMFPLYRGHRIPGKRKRDAAQGEAQGEVMETAKTSFPTRDEEEMDDMDQHMDEAFDEEDTDASFPGVRLEQEIEDQRMDDKFDEQETQVEAAKAENHGEHIRRLEVKEKKQVRCFLPQLVAELMGSCKERTLVNRGFLNMPKETKRFGIGLVGVKARFVTMVIQDKSEKSEYPGPSDIEKNKNVSTKVFMTEELNLFKKSHLMTFFEILFAMGKI